MFEQAYRRRIDADLARWQADGTITGDAASAIRLALGPAPRGAGAAAVVGTVGGLLIVAAILVFVAANWEVIPRPVRLALMIAGIAAAHGLGGMFARAGRGYLADACASFGAIIFGATVALVGQMYHLPADFSAGFLLWALGALAGAVLTGSRGALAVALCAGAAWSVAVALDLGISPHWAYLAFWLSGVALAIAWDSPSARHLAALSLVGWWIETAIGFDLDKWPGDFAFVAAVGASLMLGAGLALECRGPPGMRRLGATHASYGGLGIAFAVTLSVLGLTGLMAKGWPIWLVGSAGAGAILAGLAALLSRRVGPALAAAAILLALATAMAPDPDTTDSARWTIYAFSLASMLALLVSGAVDMVRPRLVAGWIGLGLVIAAITWRVEGELLTRALFLACAGGAAILLAVGLGRLQPKEAR